MADFTLPATTHLGTVRLRVSDIARAVDFYCDVIGLRVIDQSNGTAHLSATGHQPTLLELVEVPGARPAPRTAAGLFHVAIRLPDRSALARSLDQLRVVNWPLQGAADHAVSEAVYLADPDGNGLELYWDRPRETWPVRDNQIAMVTHRLDLRDLLAQAGAAQWTGIDPGADIGHMHLAVSDLAQAKAFYSDRLGLDIMQSDFPGALFLAAGGYHHHLGLNVWNSQGRPPAPPDAAGLIGFEIVLPNAETWQTVIAQLATRGLVPAAQHSGATPRAEFHAPDDITLSLVSASGS